MCACVCVCIWVVLIQKLFPVIEIFVILYKEIKKTKQSKNNGLFREKYLVGTSREMLPLPITHV